MRKAFIMSLVVSSVITTLILMSTVTSAYSFGYYNPVKPVVPHVVPTIPKVPSLTDVKMPKVIITEEEVEELAKNVKIDDSDPHDMDFNKWNEEHVYDKDLCHPIPPIDVRNLCPWGLLHGFRYPIFRP